jgi:hypothetical protein
LLQACIYPFERTKMAKPIIEAIKYVVFFHLELFSICFRFNDDIIDVRMVVNTTFAIFENF